MKKTKIEYKKHIDAYTIFGSVYSSDIIGSTLEELDKKINQFIDQNKDTSTAITVGTLITTTVEYGGGDMICYTFSDDEPKHPYLYLKYFKERDSIIKIK